MATPVASFLTRARCSSNSLMIRFNPWTLVHHRIVGFQCRQQQQQRQLCCLLVSSRPGEERNCREHRISAACPRSATIFRLPVNYRSNSQTRHWSSSSNSNSNSNDTSNYSYSEYENWVRRLYQTNKFHPVKLGLENIERLHDLLGRPMDQPNVAVIHIAGTNGKGSVALKIAKTLELLDLKVGLFCSPHVSCFRERMQINGRLISEQEVTDLLPQIYELCEEHAIPATFFEITTALAFLFYHTNNADVVVLETGLGGRLDSTNVVKSPACAVITSIGMEHTRILGDTIEKIAREKAGIIKPSRPVLVGPQCPQDVLRACATERGASVYYTCSDILGNGNSQAGISTQQTSSLEEEHSSVPDYDLENARIATAALKIVVEQEKCIAKLATTVTTIPDHIIQQGTSQRPPCRFELVKRDGWPLVILDVAHNPQAMQYLVRKLKATYPDRQFRLVVGMSSDKDSNLCGQFILEAADQSPQAIHLVQASHPRAKTLEGILSADSSGLLKDSHYDLDDRSVTRQIALGLELAQQKNEILVVCGSVFLMAEAREALGFEEPRDSKVIEEVAGAHMRAAQENFSSDSSTSKASTV